MSDLHDAAAAELNAVMDALHEEMRWPDLDLGEFTTAQYGKRNNITTSEAAHELERAWKRGKVTRRREVIHGRDCWIYKFIPFEPSNPGD